MRQGKTEEEADKKKMRRPRPAYAHQAAGARICASLWAGGVLDPRDAEVLAEVTRNTAPDARVPPTPLGQCAALAAAGGPEWRRQVDAWAAFASLGQPAGVATTVGVSSPMGPGPATKRFRTLTPSADASHQGMPPYGGASTAVWPTGLTQGETALAPYERALPAELQSAIMQYLIEADPRTAIALSGASALQTALLTDEAERVAQRRAQYIGDVRQGASAAGDYMRARTAFGGDPRDAPLSIALCLMEAFVRFLFDMDKEQDSTLQNIDTALANTRRALFGRGARPQGGPPPPHSLAYSSDLVDAVASDPRLGGLQDRVRAWYEWIETPMRARGISSTWQRQNPQSALAALERQPSSRDVPRQGIIQHLMLVYGASAPAVLAEPLQPVGAGVEVGPAHGAPDRVLAQPLVRFKLPTLDMDHVIDLLHTRPEEQGAFNAEAYFRNLTGATPDEFINRGVRRYLRGTCASVARDTPLAMPDFTSVFEMTFFLRPGIDSDLLMATIRSPAVERLLA
nr:hypothetical protein [Pandoravirus aubagnensis]